MKKAALFILIALPVSLAQGFIGLGSITDAIVSLMLQLIADSLHSFLSIATFLIATNPYIAGDVFAIHSKLIALLAPLYILILTWNGIQLMASKGIASQVGSKAAIQNAVVSMLLVAASLPIYQSLLDLSQAVSSFFLAASFPDVGAPSLSTIALFTLIFFFLTLFVIFLAVRFIFISLGVVIFPIGIFLYFFTPTKAYGRLLLSLIFMLLFIQILFALIISIMTIVASTPPQAGFSGIAEQTYKLVIFLGGLFLLVLIPSLLVLQVIVAAIFPEIKLFSLLASVLTRQTSF